MELALFDFDNTITRKDTLFHFIRHTRGFWKFWRGIIVLSPFFAAFAFKRIPNHALKEYVLGYYFRNWTAADFENAGRQYCRQHLPKILKKSAMERIYWHKSKGHRIVIVTASLETWVREWSDTEELDLIATRILTENGRISGRLQTPNCNGNEKVRRITSFLCLDDYRRIYAYGDSDGDQPMLSLAHESFYRSFK